MSDVRQVNFGKEERDTVRAFARLFRIVEERESDIVGRPGFYLEQANARMMVLHSFAKRAADALRPPMVGLTPEQGDFATYRELETVRVTKEEYDRLRLCASVVRAMEDLL